MPGLVISAVNYSEVVAKLADSGVPEAAILRILNGLSLETIAFDEVQGLQAGLLRPATKGHGLSLGDRSCLALGLSLGSKILTTDKAWARLGIDDVQVIR